MLFQVGHGRPGGPILQIYHDLDVLLEPAGGGTQIYIEQQEDPDAGKGERGRENRYDGGRAIGPDVRPGLAEQVEDRPHRITWPSAMRAPLVSVTTLRLTCVMTEGSCVATMTVVPRALITLKSSRIPPVKPGPRLPVGSSASSTT